MSDPRRLRARYTPLLAVGSLLTVLSLLPARAHARRLFRARFEVGTLEVEKPGAFAFDAQIGGGYGDGEDGSRLIVPDFELDIGLTKWLELDIDSAYSLVQVGSDEREWVGAPIWTALRFDIYSYEKGHTGRTFGIGAQVGPRLPNLRNVAGVGFAALLLVGGGTRSAHVVANLGSIVDRDQPVGLSYGVAGDWQLSEMEKWALTGQVAGVHYFGQEPDQLLLAVGVSKELSEDLQLQASVIGGPAFEGDRIGMLAGATYRTRLW